MLPSTKRTYWDLQEKGSKVKIPVLSFSLCTIILTTLMIVAMKAFDITRPLVSAAAIGLAQRALEEATKYAQERHVREFWCDFWWDTAKIEKQTMGQPIINHQGVAFMLADMAIGVEAARGLVWKAAWAKDCKQRNSTCIFIFCRFTRSTCFWLDIPSVLCVDG